MSGLSETGRLSMLSLFRQIIQNNPQLELLNMSAFSENINDSENIGEIVLETLLSSNIESIAIISLYLNPSWFELPQIGELRIRTSNVELLVDLINKQTTLKTFDLRENGLKVEIEYAIDEQ